MKKNFPIPFTVLFTGSLCSGLYPTQRTGSTAETKAMAGQKNSALLFIGDFTAFPELWNPGIFVLKKKIGFPAPKTSTMTITKNGTGDSANSLIQ